MSESLWPRSRRGLPSLTRKLTRKSLIERGGIFPGRPFRRSTLIATHDWLHQLPRSLRSLRLPNMKEAISLSLHTPGNPTARRIFMQPGQNGLRHNLYRFVGHLLDGR